MLAPRSARAPLYLFQAENDFDLSPTRVLYAALQEAHKPGEMRIYPAFGDTAQDGGPVWYGGGNLAADLSWPKLQQRWAPDRAAPGRPAEGSRERRPAQARQAHTD